MPAAERDDERDDDTGVEADGKAGLTDITVAAAIAPVTLDREKPSSKPLSSTPLPASRGGASMMWGPPNIADGEVASKYGERWRSVRIGGGLRRIEVDGGVRRAASMLVDAPSLYV